MSNTTDLLDGLAAELATAGVVTNRTDGSAYLSTETALTFAVMPEAPDKVVMLTAYRLGGDDPAHPTSRMNVQARTRGAAGDPLGADDIDDQIYDVFHGMTNRTYGGLYVVQAMLSSSLAMQRDSNNRWQRSSNYSFDCGVPATTNRTY